MKKTTSTNFASHRKKETNRWLAWLSLCVMFLFGPFTYLYGQGNTCTAPLAIVSLPFTSSGNTSTYGNDYTQTNVPAVAPGAIKTGSSSGSTNYMNGFEVVYTITPIIDGQITITTTNDDEWVALWAFTGCPFNSTVGLHTAISGTARNIDNLPVVANTTYYIVISCWNTPGINYSLTVSGTEGLLTPLAACTGTPSGGTASLSPNGGNAGATFLAKATGVTAASALDYQWQKNVGGTWQDIAGATTLNSAIVAESGAVGSTTNYRLKVTCTASNEIAYSIESSYTISLVYCPSVPTSKDGSGITNVALGTSSFTVPNATYYNNLNPVDLIAGITNPASITFATGFAYNANIWIDLNDNGTFESAELLYQGESTSANPSVLNSSILLDATAPLGIHKMRIGTADSGQLVPDPCYSGLYGVTVDVMVNILPPPACLPPSALTALNIAPFTADLSWASTGTLFNIVWGTQGFIQESGNPVNGVSLPYTLTLPAANTTYSYYVQQDCGVTDGVSLWTGPYTFRTACAPVAAFFENFDSYTATGANNPLPNCWSRTGNTGSSYISAGGGAPMSGTKRLYLSASAATSTNAYAVMPEVTNLQAGTHRLKFKAYSSTAGKSLTVGYFESTAESANFIDLETFEMPSTALSSTVEFIYEMPDYIPAGIKSVAFRVEGGAFTGVTTIYIDDVKWEAIPLCSDILQSNITFNTIETNSVGVEWYTEGTETAWQYVYTSDATVTDPNTLISNVIDVSTPLDIIESLQPNTTYKFWVRSNCGSGSVGIWSEVKTFTTACAPTTVFPYTIDFESVTTPNIPSCTSKQNAGTGNIWATANVTSAGFSGKVLRYTYNTNNAANAWFYTNEMNLEAGIAYKVSYKYGNSTTSATAAEKLKVVYGTSAVDTEMINALADHPNVTGGVAQDNSISFTPAVSGIYVIGFNAYSDADQYSLYVDDIVIDLAPTTLPSCATNLSATVDTNCGNYATTITWDPVSSTDGYTVSIVPNNGGTPITADAGNSTSYSFTGNFNTTYTYSVIPYNSFGVAVGCTTQSFITAVNGCYCPSLPVSNDGAGISNVQIGNQDFPNGDVLYFDHTATPVDLAQGIHSNLKVKLATGVSYGTNVWIDLNDNFIFEAEELLFSAATPSSIPNPFIQDASFEMPLDAPLGQHRMRIVSTDIVQNPANPCYSGSYGVTLDFTVNIIPAPACLAPSNGHATMVTTSTATLNWTASSSAPANGYAYYVTTSTTPPSVSTVPTGTVNVGITTVDLSELPSSTTHYFYIRSICSDSDSSAWTQTTTFSTLCDANPLPYTIDFESVTVPNLPLCTINQNVGSGNNWITASGTDYGFTSKFLKYGYNVNSVANTWFFTNVVNLVAGTSYTVSYKYGGSGFTEKLKVAYGSSANDTAMTTILADHSNITTSAPENNSVSFTPTTSGLYVIGFKAYSDADEFNLYLDDIIIQETLGTTDFDNNQFTAYPNPVKNNLTIRYNENIKEVTVFNLLGQHLFTKNINATEGKVDMSNLPSGTYLVKVNSDDKVNTLKVIKE